MKCPSQQKPIDEALPQREIEMRGLIPLFGIHSFPSHEGPVSAASNPPRAPVLDSEKVLRPSLAHDCRSSIAVSVKPVNGQGQRVHEQHQG